MESGRFEDGALVPVPKCDHSQISDSLWYDCIELQKGILPWRPGGTCFLVSCADSGSWF
ncbi:hypothetical protein SynBIOSU31_00957 [Synechococcus sp. BIOS-U3-1]|nr:hypothetical protein SynBIOSU31_00957 [Synechococcus sp. BIOS-U3-1]